MAVRGRYGMRNINPKALGSRTARTMKLSNLVEIVSKVLQVRRTTTELYARRLRETGKLPQSRGRYHPDVSMDHCALLVCALLVSENARSAPAAVECWEPFVKKLAQILSDVDWASQLEGVYVDLCTGNVRIQDRRAGVKQPPIENLAKGLEPARSLIDRRASLPAGVLGELAKALS